LTLIAASFVPALAFAQNVAEKAADDLTDKGSPNVNEQRPALPAVAAGSPAGLFGSKGQLTLSSETGVWVSNTSTSGGGSTTSLTLRPALDYFFVNNFSVGGFLGVDYAKSGANHTTTFGIGPRVGYNLTFSERFSFWPKLGFSYSSSSVATPVGDVSGNHLALNLYAPVMIHPVKHFFLGFGPALDTDLTGDGKQTTIAGRLTFGGWW
jgi:hypothetical protein